MSSPRMTLRSTSARPPHSTQTFATGWNTTARPATPRPDHHHHRTPTERSPAPEPPFGAGSAGSAPMSSRPPASLHSMTTNVFKHVRSVAVPVTDQERTKSVLEQLGFVVSMDAELRPGFRWIEMELPEGHASVSLVRTGPELHTGVDTGI